MPILQATSPAIQATVMCQAVSRGTMMKVTIRSAIDRCIINKFTRDFRCLKKEENSVNYNVINKFTRDFQYLKTRKISVNNLGLIAQLLV